MEIRVLIAEPDDALREVFERYLSSRGFLVETARTIAEFVEKAVAVEPDVIMSELEFSDGSDDQVFRLLPQSAAGAAPIVVVTRRDQETEVNSGLPVAEYLQKPVPMARLVKTLRKWAKHPAASVA